MIKNCPGLMRGGFSKFLSPIPFLLLSLFVLMPAAMLANPGDQDGPVSFDRQMKS